MAAMLVVVVLVVLVVVTQVMTQPDVEASTGELLNMDSPDGVKFLPEDLCSGEGGVCGLLEACPPNERHAPGLCPAQQGQGAECCRIMPTNIRNCQSRGGECVPTAACGNAPRDALGKCSQGKVCCVFLHR